MGCNQSVICCGISCNFHATYIMLALKLLIIKALFCFVSQVLKKLESLNLSLSVVIRVHVLLIWEQLGSDETL